MKKKAFVELTFSSKYIKYSTRLFLFKVIDAKCNVPIILTLLVSNTIKQLQFQLV